MESVQKEEISTNFGPNTEELINFIKEINPSAFLNTWGPTNIVQTYDPDVNMRGILIIDNTALGPALGKIRIAAETTPRQVFNSARKMTLSCALVNINFGGAAVNIYEDIHKIDKIKCVKSFAKNILHYVPNQYIAAPDQNISQNEMAAFVEEIGDRKGATGKPDNMGGIPYELGVVGFGIAIAIESSLGFSESAKEMPGSLHEATIAIQGFDSIGCTVAKYLVNKGARIVAISDDYCAITDKDGIEINEVIQHSGAADEKHSLKRCKGHKKDPADYITNARCDILVLTSTSASIKDENLKDVQAKCVVEGVNESMGSVADVNLTQRDVLVIPDILTMAGGPISSYAEYCGENSSIAFSLIDAKIRETTKHIIDQSTSLCIPPRRVAKETAKERILQKLEATQ